MGALAAHSLAGEGRNQLEEAGSSGRAGRGGSHHTPPPSLVLGHPLSAVSSLQMLLRISRRILSLLLPRAPRALPKVNASTPSARLINTLLKK